MAPRRLGHAYSTHGVGGNLGWALAPVVSYSLGLAFGWRTALVAMGLVGAVVLALLALGALERRWQARPLPRPRPAGRHRFRVFTGGKGKGNGHAHDVPERGDAEASPGDKPRWLM